MNFPSSKVKFGQFLVFSSFYSDFMEFFIGQVCHVCNWQTKELELKFYDMVRMKMADWPRDYIVFHAQLS